MILPRCSCATPGFCKTLGRDMSAGMIAECKGNEDFRRDLLGLSAASDTMAINYSEPVAIALKPACVHLGTVSQSCGCGDRLRDISHCLNEASDKPRCWRSPLESTLDDVQSCERCGHYELTPIGSLFPGRTVIARCINLDRRPDRWQEFLAGCPFAGIERVAAVDGHRATDRPLWWLAGGGALGCFRSHLGILERAIADGVETLIVFEDDAIFPPDAAERIERFVAALPDDWDMLYLGGQFQTWDGGRPTRISDEVLRCCRTNRTHAMVLRGRFIRIAYDFLMDWESWSKWPQNHIDHRLENLHIDGRYNIYAPSKWIVGQAEGQSDIANRAEPERFWN